jgi:type VI secretion system protein ImpE
MSLKNLIQSGNLASAITAATDDVKRQPTKIEARVVLAELMCFSGNFDRGDTLIEGAMKIRGGQPVPGLILLRQLLRGEVARQQWYEEGRPPQVRTEPTDDLKAAMLTVVEYREKHLASAAEQLRGMEKSYQQSGTLKGLNGEAQSFTQFRDLNDLCPSVAELISPNGQFLWVPWSDFLRIKFDQAKTLRDILWRPAECEFRDGSQGNYYMPCLYSGSAQSTQETIRLGQGTDWIEQGEGIVTGVGLRMFLTDEATPTILEIEEIRFAASGE